MGSQVREKNALFSCIDCSTSCPGHDSPNVPLPVLSRQGIAAWAAFPHFMHSLQQPRIFSICTRQHTLSVATSPSIGEQRMETGHLHRGLKCRAWLLTLFSRFFLPVVSGSCTLCSGWTSRGGGRTWAEHRRGKHTQHFLRDGLKGIDDNNGKVSSIHIVQRFVGGHEYWYCPQL